MSTGTRWNASPLRWNHKHEDDGESSGPGVNSSLPSLEREGSTYSSNRNDTSAEDVADRAASEIGSVASHRSHTYQESILSDEGLQGVPAYSKRTNKSSKLRKPADEDAEKPNSKGNPGIPSAGYNYSGDLSSWSGSVEFDRHSASHWTESEDTYSEFTSSSGTANHSAARANRNPAGQPNLSEIDSEFSMRMEDVRGQRLRNHRPPTPGNRSPARQDFPELNSEFSMRMEEQRDQRTKRSQLHSRDGMRTSVRSNPETTHLPVPNNHVVQSPHCCLHCRTDACGAFLHLRQVCCDNGTCRSCSHTCCYPSAAHGRRCHLDPSNLAHRGGPLPNNRTGTDTARDRNQTRKRSEWPVFGGASYIICYKCDNLIQIPANFHFLGGKFNRMQCGVCSRVISYSLVDKTRIVRSSSSEFSGQLSGDSATPARSIYGDSASPPPHHHHQSNPRINSEEYSSTEYETDASGSSNPLGRAKETKKRQKALHRLMGYLSARDVLNYRQAGS